MKELFIVLAVLLVFSHCQAAVQIDKQDLLNPDSPTGSSANNATGGSTVDGGTNSSSSTPSGSNNTGDTNATSNDTLTPTTNGTSTSSGINKRAAIIGGSVTAGALVLAGGIAAAVLLAKKHRRNKTKDPRPILAASSKKRKPKKIQAPHVSHNSIQSQDLQRQRALKQHPSQHSFNRANESYAVIARKKITSKHQRTQRNGYGSISKNLDQPKQSWANKERERVMGSVGNKQNEPKNHLLRRARRNKRRGLRSSSSQNSDSEIEEGSHSGFQGRLHKRRFSMKPHLMDQDQMPPPPLPPRLGEDNSFAGMNRYHRARV